MIAVQHRRVKVLWWQLPPSGFHALSSDGASEDGYATGRGIIRYSLGNLVATYHRYYGPGSNNLAEFRALHDCLRLYADLGFARCYIHVDSLLVCNRFSDTWCIPWHLQIWSSKLEALKQMMHYRIMHELNFVADFMACEGLCVKSNCTYYDNFPARVEGWTV
ncbi:hypothetical protein BVC80_1385g3 [Macleaya cordata]|uniref:RNase H type-1 domain-containing protein n=1 Tax=Macleaya cordata TaxID=56857 RepID=A0A200Q5S6_MACCD|nr:hypothetical protein BVC80_1385g3 [Macleaya cordata]